MGMSYSVYVGPLVECRESAEKVSWGDVIETINEDLHAAGDDYIGGALYWLPNKSKHGNRFDRGDGEGFVGLDAAALNTADFEARYAAAIEALRKAYGAASVTVRFGVVAYYT